MNDRYNFDLTGPEMNSLLIWLRDYQNKIILSEGNQTIYGSKSFQKDVTVVSDGYNTRKFIATNYVDVYSGYAKTFITPYGINIGRYSGDNTTLSNLYVYAYPDDGGGYYAKISNNVYAYDPEYGDYTNIYYDYDFPRGSGTLALQSDTPSYQSTSVVVGNAVTNINGRVFQNYTATLVTSGNYVYYQIYKNGSIVTNKNTAKEYMHYMTGSYFVPEYHYDFPKQTLFVFADSSIWKPQFDETNGLRLYRISTPLALKSDIIRWYKHEISIEEDDFYNKHINVCYYSTRATEYTDFPELGDAIFIEGYCEPSGTNQPSEFIKNGYDSLPRGFWRWDWSTNSVTSIYIESPYTNFHDTVTPIINR